MTDPSEPLPWPHGDAEASTGQPAGFLWPSPPYAAYPPPQVQQPRFDSNRGHERSSQPPPPKNFDRGDRGAGRQSGGYQGGNSHQGGSSHQGGGDKQPRARDFGNPKNRER